VKAALKKLAGAVLGDYSIYCLYSRVTGGAASAGTPAPAALRCVPIDEAALQQAGDALLLDQLGDLGSGARGYACLEEERIVGVCFYWFGERYRQRNYWPLAEGEAKLVQIIGLPDQRGRGIAARLIRSSSEDMLRGGFGRLFARIWHSNTPSRLAFESAGWTCQATLLDINPLRRAHGMRLRLPGRMLTR
jgi:GNAT superfamily N-acetyltransferase